MEDENGKILFDLYPLNIGRNQLEIRDWVVDEIAYLYPELANKVILNFANYEKDLIYRACKSMGFSTPKTGSLEIDIWHW